jgi:hypothetical protein
MVKLNAGNVLLKPSHRRQLMAWLKRSQKLGQQIGNFLLTINMHRSGRMTEVTALVHHSVGNYSCRVRGSQWHDAMRQIVRLLSSHLSAQRLMLAQ